MICEAGKANCVFGKSRVLNGIADNVRKCEFKGITEGQFAAVDAFIANVDLPYVDINGMMSVSCDNFNACQDTDVSLVSTLISLVSSYKQIRNVIVFDDNVQGCQCIIKSVDATRTRGNAGVTCIVSTAKTHSHSYTVSVSTMPTPVTVHQDRIIDILKTIVDIDYSLSWISSSKFMELATAMQHRPTNMWVNNTGTAMDTVSIVGSHGTRILPMMYTLPAKSNIISVNFGSPLPNLAPRLQDTCMRLNTVVCQTINAGTKNRKCYYCSLMETIHDISCANDSIQDHIHTFSFGPIVSDILAG